MSARSPGEKRRRAEKRERERLAFEGALASLRAAGASCATCKHRGKFPTTSEPVCDLETDFMGYMKVTLTHLCPEWKARAGANITLTPGAKE